MSGDEAVALQERAVWDLLALFFMEAQQAQQGLAAQVGRQENCVVSLLFSPL